MSLDGRDHALAALREALRESGNVRSIAEAIAGTPTKRNGNQWRWGKRGSLAIWIAGPTAGLVYDHEAVDGGDMLWWIQREQRADFPGAVAWARDFLRLPIDARPVRQDPWRSSRAGKAGAEAVTELERIDRARALWRDAVPIANTLGERYLIEVRGIPRPQGGWPEVIRYHAAHQAVAMAATDNDGAVRAVQMIYLQANAAKRDDVGSNGKLTYGAPKGAAVRLPSVGDAADEGETSSPLLGAEGPETGLSAWVSSGHETWISLGSMSRLPPLPTGRLFVACADDDPDHAPAAKLFRKAEAAWRASGVSVVVAWPWERRYCDKSDFNDVLRSHGSRLVQGRIQAAIESAKRSPGLDTVDVRVAEVRVSAAVRRFLGAAAAWTPPDLDGLTPSYPPPVHAIRVSVGVGKTAHALAAIALRIIRMRRRGDRRTVAFAVPRHTLGEEVVRTFSGLREAVRAGLTATVWRGRGAPDPTGPGYGDPTVPREELRKMCKDLPAVTDAQQVGAVVETSVCRRQIRDRKTKQTTELLCPYFAACLWQAQKSVSADLVVVPHEALFHLKPKHFGDLAFVVVDESCWQDGLEGIAGKTAKGIALTLEALRDTVSVPNGEGGEDLDATHRLNDLQARVLAALEKLPPGAVPRQALIQAGIRPEDAVDAAAWTWRRKIEPEIWPGMPAEERRQAVAAAAGNTVVMRLARFWRAVERLVAEDGPTASGWLALASVTTDAGPQRILRLTGRRDVAAGWLVPTLLMDAVLDVRLVRPFWNQVDVTAEVNASEPNARYRQLTGGDVSLNSLLADEWCAGDKVECARRAHNIRDVFAVALRELRQHGGVRCLAVAQQRVESYWRSNFAVPNWLDLAHHNGIAGSNEWSRVPGIVICGRTAPPASAVEMLRGALTGEAVSERVEGKWPKVAATVYLRDGTTQTVKAERHPDELAEAIRFQICEGELIQIAGRGRGVRRGPSNPLDVLILTDRPLPLPVELVTWEALAPSPRDQMLAAGGVAFRRPADASAAYGEIWATADAAKKAFSRWDPSPDSNAVFTRSASHHAMVSYQRAGAGYKATELEFDPEARPDLAAWLEEKLGGTLANLDVTMSAAMPAVIPEREDRPDRGATTPTQTPPPADDPTNYDDDEDLAPPPLLDWVPAPWEVPPPPPGWPAPLSRSGFEPHPTG